MRGWINPRAKGSGWTRITRYSLRMALKGTWRAVCAIPMTLRVSKMAWKINVEDSNQRKPKEERANVHNSLEEFLIAWLHVSGVHCVPSIRVGCRSSRYRYSFLLSPTTLKSNHSVHLNILKAPLNAPKSLNCSAAMLQGIILNVLHKLHNESTHRVWKEKDCNLCVVAQQQLVQW